MRLEEDKNDTYFKTWFFMRIFEKTVHLLTEIIVSEPKAGWPKSSVFNNLDKLDKIPNANFKESKISMCFWTKIQPIWGFKIFEFYPVKKIHDHKKYVKDQTDSLWCEFLHFQPFNRPRKKGARAKKDIGQFFLSKWLTQMTQITSPESSWQNNHHRTVWIFGKKLQHDGQAMKARCSPTNEFM